MAHKKPKKERRLPTQEEIEQGALEARAYHGLLGPYSGADSLPAESTSQADIEHEFAIIEAEKRRRDYLTMAKEAAPASYRGPPIIDFSEVVKQGLRTKPLAPATLGYESSQGLDEDELQRRVRSLELTPSSIQYKRLLEGRLGQYDYPEDRVTVNPYEHGSSVSAFLKQDRGRQGPHPRGGMGARRGPLPTDERPMIETEVHELTHRVAKSVLRDPLFAEVYEASQESGENLLSGFFESGYGNLKLSTEKGVLPDFTREHQMIRAATEGSDPTKPPEYRTLAGRAHTPQSIKDARDFNELVKRYWKERRKRDFIKNQRSALGVVSEDDFNK